MNRLILLLSFSMLLTACQLQVPKPAQFSCRLNDARLLQLQQLETQFLNEAKQRGSLLRQSITDKDSIRLALLLSTPYSSTEQLQQAKRHFKKLDIQSSSDCLGDQYLQLRDRQTSALLWLRSEQDKLQQRNLSLQQQKQKLQKQLEALTQIEAELSMSREVQP